MHNYYSNTVISASLDNFSN